MMKILFYLKQYLKMAVQNFLLPLTYNMYRHKKVNKKRIIFADARHDSIPFSLSELYKELSNTDYEIISYTHNHSELTLLKSLWLMIRFMKLYASAGYVFVCDYYLPIASCNKRSETYVVQVLHGGGPMKKFGYDSPEDIPPLYKGNVFRNYNLVPVSADYMVPIMAHNMRQQDGVVQALGFSRTDRYFDADYIQACKDNFYTAYPEAKARRLVMWAPTFRGNAAHPYLVGTDAVTKLQNVLGDEWYVIIKAHPHIDAINTISNCSIPSEDLLPVIDILITDYSSIFYDYITLLKPVVLFVPDIAEYTRSRGLYVDLHTLPCPIVTDENELAGIIKELPAHYDSDGIYNIYKEYMGACDGQATRRILEYIGL